MTYLCWSYVAVSEAARSGRMWLRRAWYQSLHTSSLNHASGVLYIVVHGAGTLKSKSCCCCCACAALLASGAKGMDGHPMYPCAKLKLDQLFLQWLSLPESQTLVS